jgi:LSD1 subclass zinc finger protein
MACVLVCPNCRQPVEVPSGSELPWVTCPHCQVTVPNTAGPRLPAVLRWTTSAWFGPVLVLIPVMAWSLPFVVYVRVSLTPLALMLLFFGGLILLRVGQLTLARILPPRWAVTATVALGVVLLAAWGVVLLAMLSGG